MTTIADRGRPRIGVVIPYFDQPDRLRSILRSLDHQTCPPVAVVVADDGSSKRPDTSGHDGVVVVRQPDRGIRPAAARNLGRSALPDGLHAVAFLDGDTIPTDDYLERLCAPLVDGTADVTVGRRRYADMTGMSATEAADWVLERAPDDDRRWLLPPGWLDDGYRATNDMTDGSFGVWRYVISAVVACSPTLYDAVGGFDPTIDVYGGEDWELAFRAWNSGARFRYVADAVAVHDGPDFGGRAADPNVKARETACAAQRITDPSARGHGLLRSRSDGAVDLHLASELAANLTTIDQLLSGTWHDVTIGLLGDDEVVAEVLRWCAPDPRVVAGSVPDGVSTRWRLLATGPAEVDVDSIERLCRPVAQAETLARSTRIGAVRWTAWSRRLTILGGLPRTTPPDASMTDDVVASDLGLRAFPDRADLAAHFRRSA